MKIIDRLREDGIHISFEIFPPKTDAGYDKVIRAAEEMAGLKPEFISVTYGAGGGTSKNTAKIASYIKHDLHVESLAHLTCASSTKDEVRSVIASLKEQGIENILALRGDISEDMVFPSEDRFHYAYQLVEEIRRHGDFCIGAACYPEGHVKISYIADLQRPETVGAVYEETGAVLLFFGLQGIQQSCQIVVGTGIAALLQVFVFINR